MGLWTVHLGLLLLAPKMATGWQLGQRARKRAALVQSSFWGHVHCLGGVPRRCAVRHGADAGGLAAAGPPRFRKHRRFCRCCSPRRQRTKRLYA